MAQYLIEREIPGAGSLSEEQLKGMAMYSTEVMKELGIEWVHSYVTDDKVYCVYHAPDEGAILEHAKRLGQPANRISAVRHTVGSEGVK